ncbi:MAG: hypothetical protein CM15mP117_25260 [Alphaproteobacteria bacterium]|nr:MAG: hypothetical protein CM15mP117_25260 [Alphaproteobacteria bacterium]
MITNQLKFNFEYFGLQIIRAIAMCLTTFCFFIAVKHMPLADSISIFFVEPMILTLLSVIFLGEVIRFRRIIAIIIGFIGALIIIRPQFNSVSRNSCIFTANYGFLLCSLYAYYSIFF